MFMFLLPKIIVIFILINGIERRNGQILNYSEDFILINKTKNKD